MVGATSSSAATIVVLVASFERPVGSDLVLSTRATIAVFTATASAASRGMDCRPVPVE